MHTLLCLHSLLPDIRRELAKLRAPSPDLAAGNCLYIAHAVATVLHNKGLRPIIQAGSLQWPIVTRDLDDGVSSSHFAYMWDPTHPRSVAARAAGQLPEMHVWLGLLDPPTLIDFSTRDLKGLAEASGLIWRSGDPPEFLWATEDEMPDWVVYTPNRDATLYAAMLLKSRFDPTYLKR
jgi:hypothetical protein